VHFESRAGVAVPTRLSVLLAVEADGRRVREWDRGGLSLTLRSVVVLRDGLAQQRPAPPAEGRVAIVGAESCGWYASLTSLTVLVALK